jgi:hypothetical protein
VATSADIDKIKRFGAILGYNFIGKKGRAHWERAAAYIRALSQLGDDDIKVREFFTIFSAEILQEPSRNLI